VQSIIKSGHHLKNLLSDVLDFSKIEAARIQIEKTHISLPDFISDIEFFGRAQAEDKGLAFSTAIDTPLPAAIQSDPTRIKQILINLITNAVKFTDAPGSVHLSIALDQDNGLLRFQLSDTGIGITREEMKRLFRPFEQADVSTTRRFGGTGLGLVISRTFADLLGGTLSADSVPSEGSLFTVTIATGLLADVPLLSESSFRAPVRRASDLPPLLIPQLSGRILLAEDNPDNQALIKLLVGRTGAQIVVANNGQEAVEIAQGSEFDLVLMDMQMPVMRGLDATSLLRLTGFTAPIVALTANASTSDRAQALAEGCNDFLTKPIEMEPFFSILDHYLPKRENEPANAAPSALEDDPVYKSMCRDFIDGLSADVYSIKSSIAEENWDGARVLAHQLKGAGGSFGRPDVSMIGGRLESALMQKHLSALPPLLRELEQACRFSP
jgi:CheY-like chemotaxis protein/HPt (histidine-containing phosphotransfer) domain-containing protein